MNKPGFPFIVFVTYDSWLNADTAAIGNKIKTIAGWAVYKIDKTRIYAVG